MHTDATILISEILSKINWTFYLLSIIVAFGVGAVWYSLIFFKMWKRVFKVDASAQNAGPLVRSLIIQFISGIFLGLSYFILMGLSTGLTLTVMAGFCTLQICNLSFKYGSIKDFMRSVLIEVGYTIVGGSVYIVLSLV